MTDYHPSAAEREQFAAIADVLIPEAAGMPSASSVDVAGPMLDHVLALRPDLTPGLRRGLELTKDADGPARAAGWLNENDTDALNAIGLIASAIYFMQPGIRKLLGYPGQASRPVRPEEEDDWREGSLLDPVRDRGPIWTRPPQQEG